MKLLTNGTEIPYISVSVIESIMQYYVTLNIVLPCRLSTDVFQLSDQELGDSYKVLRSRMVDDTYEYTAVPMDVYDRLNSEVASFEGVATLKSLCSKVGIPCALQSDTTPVYWRIPKCSLTSFISYLSDYADFPQGGAPRFYLNSKGQLTGFDIRTIIRTSPVKNILVEPTTDSHSLESQVLFNPGTTNFIVYTPEGISSKTITFEKNTGEQTVTVNDTTGHEYDLTLRCVRNRFYTKFFTSRTLTATLTSPVKVGDCVSINGIGKFVVTSLRVDNNPGDSGPNSIINLSSSYENS